MFYNFFLLFSSFSLPFFMKYSFKFFPVFQFEQKLGGNGQNISLLSACVVCVCTCSLPINNNRSCSITNTSCQTDSFKESNELSKPYIIKKMSNNSLGWDKSCIQYLIGIFSVFYSNLYLSHV